ncbi:SOS response associated peptidase (SRAP) [Ruminococcus flavefaciens]|uniref:SOS response associated peptidase (SRAP) n=2 Tax=Ruminococcus flavefaciens TaxID=1265 RepID=A0A1M7GAY0_RUMFL|nr:SOS response-associated peptidase family protein [Ruminococcus flavefaciens]SHM13433.1 SOS response associated peptidase (SRAP) [Ruminococcus flavefaciens]
MQIPIFSILTREATGTVKDIHDRMPLILDKKDLKEWIRPNRDPSTIVEKALTNMVFEQSSYLLSTS